jgi:hypothetical protein
MRLPQAGANYYRLAEIKAKWDPENLLRMSAAMLLKAPPTLIVELLSASALTTPLAFGFQAVAAPVVASSAAIEKQHRPSGCRSGAPSLRVRASQVLAVAGMAPICWRNVSMSK